MKQSAPITKERINQILRELGFEGDAPAPRPIQAKTIEPVAIYEVATVDGVYALDADDSDDEVEF